MSGGYPDWSNGGGGRQGQGPPMQRGGYPMHPPPPPPQQKASWLLPDYAGGPRGGGNMIPPPPMPPMPPPHQRMYPPGQQGGYGGYGGGNGYAKRPPPPRAASEVSFDTSAKDPASIRARIFIGCLNASQEPVSREDVIELCLPFGSLRGVTHFKKQGYAFIQFEDANDANGACRELNGIRWRGCQLDVHPVAAPPSRPTHVADKQPEKAVPTTTYDEISYDTSSNEPAALRSRIFIGSLARSPVTRNDVIELFMQFGKLTGVTLFHKQGYAFVQMESAVDAVEACEKLHATNWKGNMIDVHLVMEGTAGGRKRNTDESGSLSPASSYAAVPMRGVKRAKQEEPPKPSVELLCKVCRKSCGSLAEFMQHREGGACKALTRTGEPPCLACSSCDAVLPNAWRLLFHLMDQHKLKLVTVDGSEAGLEKAQQADAKGAPEWWAAMEKWLDDQKAEEEGEVDEEKEEKEMKALFGATIVCRRCGLVTEDWSAYTAHKQKDCIKPRDPMEPACLACAMCGEGFVSAWKALFHLIDFHRMKPFTPAYSKEAQARADEQQCARETANVERKMKKWIESQPATPSQSATSQSGTSQ